MLREDQIEVMIDQEKLENRIAELGKQISEDYADRGLK